MTIIQGKSKKSFCVNVWMKDRVTSGYESGTSGTGRSMLRCMDKVDSDSKVR